MFKTDIFENAIRNKFRYPFKGLITTEDLWDLSLEQLDVVFRALSKESYDKKRDSLMLTPDTTAAEIDSKIAVVRYIFDVKSKERDARARQAEVAAQKNLIMEILAKKQNDSLMNMSEEELLKKLADLG